MPTANGDRRLNIGRHIHARADEGATDAEGTAENGGETGKTIFYITHDIFEALLLSTHLAVMTAGPEAGIKAVFQLDLKEPRSPSNPDFAAMYSRIESLIDEEVQRMRAR